MLELKQIDELVEKSKKNSRLSKQDERDAILLLTELMSEKENWGSGLDSAMALPSEVSAKVTISVWESQSEEDKCELVNQFINKDKNYTGLIRQIYLVHGMLRTSIQSALDILYSLSKSATDFGKKIPNKKIMQTCTKTILSKDGLGTVSFEGKSIHETDFTPLGVLIVTSLLNHWENSKRSSEDLDYVHKGIGWLSLTGGKAEIDQKVKNDIEKGVQNFDIEIQKVLYNMGFINQVCDTDKKQNYTERAKESKDETPKMSRDSFDNSSSNDVKKSSGIQGDILLNQLKNYLDDLNFNNLKLDANINQARNEVEIEKNKRQQSDDIVKELRLQLSVEIKKNEYLNEQLNKRREELNRLEVTISEKERNHQEKIDSLIDMTEKENMYVKDEFKNKLTKKLRLEYQDLKDTYSDEMTVELGENLKAQLEGVFQILKQEGLKF